MFVIYKPEGQESQRLEFKPGKVRLDEMTKIERQYSREAGEKASFESFVQDVRAGHAAALRVLLFTLLRRTHATIRYEDVNPLYDEIDVQFHAAELRELIANVQATPDWPDKNTYLARLRVELANAPDAEEGEPGKAAGTSSSTATSNSKAARSPRRGRSTS